MNLHQTPPTNSVLITQRPDALVALDSNYFFCSSSGENDQARLEFFAETLFPVWLEKCYTLHQFSDYVAQFGIELWTAENEVALTADYESGLEPFAFFLRFTRELQGEILIQCELYRHDKVH